MLCAHNIVLYMRYIRTHHYYLLLTRKDPLAFNSLHHFYDKQSNKNSWRNTVQWSQCQKLMASIRHREQISYNSCDAISSFKSMKNCNNAAAQSTWCIHLMIELALLCTHCSDWQQRCLVDKLMRVEDR